MKKIIALLLTLAFIMSSVPIAFSETAEMPLEEPALTIEAAEAEAVEAEAAAEAAEAEAPADEPETPVEDAELPPEQPEADVAAPAEEAGDAEMNAVELPTFVITGGGVLTQYNGSSPVVVIPATVVSISAGAFKGNTRITQITIPSTVQTIGENAFEGCKNLTVKVDADSYAHNYCKENNVRYVLTGSPDPTATPTVKPTATPTPSVKPTATPSVKPTATATPVPTAAPTATATPEPTAEPIPDFVVKDGTLVAYNGKATSVEIPADLNITTIGSLVFHENENAKSIRSVILPAGVKAIKTSAFYGCTNLVSVVLPRTMEEIDAATFYGCKYVTVGVYNGTYAHEFCVKNKIDFSLIDCSHNWKITKHYNYTVSCIFPGYADVFCTLCHETRTNIWYIPNCAWSELITTDDYSYKCCMTCGTIRSTWVSSDFEGFEGCAEVVSGNYGPQLEGKHRNLEIIEEKKETCTTPGHKGSVKCRACGEVIKEGKEIPAHTLKTIPEVPATCVKEGSTAGIYCETCKKYVSEPKPIPMTDHNYVADVKEATCTEPGLVKMVCTICKVESGETVTIPANGHTPVTSEGKDATCTEPGITAGSVCSSCNALLEDQEVIPAKGHSVVTVPGTLPSCTMGGTSDGSYCSVCNTVLTLQTILPATGHSEKILPAVPATNKESGLTEGKICSVCNEVLEAQEVIPALLPFVVLNSVGSNGSYTMSVGDSVVLDPVFADENGWTIRQWRSGSSKIAPVDDGVVEALAEGDVTITVNCTNGKKATIKISVIDPTSPAELIFNCSDRITLAIGEEFSLETEVLPETAEYELSYKFNKKYLTVDEDGLITGVKRGRSSVTVTASNDNGASVSRTISVNVLKEPSELSLNYSEGTLVAGGKTFTLKASFDSSSYGAMLYWSSSDESVLTVDPSGLLTPISKGIAVVTAETASGLVAECTVTVTAEPTEIYLEESDLTLAYKQSYQLDPQLLDEDGTVCKGKISYESSHPKNVYVSSSGKITIKRSTPGEAEIILTSENGLTASVYVTVAPVPSEVWLDEEEIELFVDEEYQIEPLIPEDSITTFSYSSSKRSVAKVDEDGLITAVSDGTARITIKTHNGKRATLKVTVYE